VRQKYFSELLEGIEILERTISPDPKINTIVYDSRDVKKGALFVALTGMHTNGHRYIRDALRRGAHAVVVQEKDAVPAPPVCFARTADTRFALSALASHFYDSPSEYLNVIGVTGTDGKSSTVWFIHQLLQYAGLASGFISTTSYQTAETVLSNPFRQSTPEAPEIQALLFAMAQNGKRYAVIEATSHGLSHKTSRLRHVWFDSGVFTNLTHEHLEFHGNRDNYRSDKANLFRCLRSSPPKRDRAALERFSAPHFAVLNRSDPAWEYFARAAGVPCHTYSLRDRKADVYAHSLKATDTGTRFTVCSGDKEYPLLFAVPGFFNVENLLAALLAVSLAAAVPIDRLIPHVPRLTGVRGRMQAVDMGQPFDVIVDFAHTPAAFAKLLPFARSRTKGRLICVFGSAGERDVEKRPLQGEIADEYCDLVILTDEDPRGEDSLDVIRDIARGCKRLQLDRDLFFIPDRGKAVARAVALARAGDTVLLLGKGHETSILYADKNAVWDEIKAARESLAGLGYSGDSKCLH